MNHDELTREADALTGGPAFNAWPIRGRRLRPHKGGGGGDGGARQMEEDRQRRISAAVNRINSIFNGADTYAGVGKASQYVPGQTYYNADGSVFVAPMKTVQQEVSHDQAGYYQNPNGDSPTWQMNSGVYEQGGDSNSRYYRDAQVADQDAINKALQNGLYTSVQKITGQSRQPLYDEQRQAVYDLNSKDVNRQFSEAERANRFGLARAGLMGGSADIDSNAELQRRTNEGLIKAAGIGDQAAADLRSADERARQNLISMAQSGIDTGTAGQMALGQLDANSQNAASARSGATVGSLFGDLAQAYLYGQQQAGLRAGMSPYQSYFQPGVSNSTRSGYGGNVQ